jgi:hypothetical protein
MSWLDINQRLTRIFGLDGQRVRAFTLRAEAGQPAVITVTRLLIEDGDVRELEQSFGLVAHQLPDPGDPYEQAMDRVRVRIDELALQASKKLKDDHLKALVKLANRRGS